MTVVDAVVERFAHHSPVTLMARLALQRTLKPSWIDEVFAQHARHQYVRELLFSTTVDLMSLVAVGLRPSLHAAAQAAGAALPVSVTALYDKVNGTEPALVRALVAGSAQRLAPVMAALQRGKPALAAGWHVRILDGSHLAASERRIKPLRGYRGAALPGQSLVVFDPDSALVVDVVPVEDAHVQERLLMPALLAQAQRGELWLADCNFSTRAILGGWAAQGACFIVREHGVNAHPTPCGPPRPCGRIDTGTVSEQPVELPPPEGEGGEPRALRRIELTLDVPTEDGDTVVRLLSNLAPEAMDACTMARRYRRRWSIECLFQRLEAVLHSEVASLGQPRAALLAFGVAVLAYNVLAVLQAAVAVCHATEVADVDDVSLYYLADEVRAHYAGMLVAVEPQAWDAYERLDAAALAQALLDIAAHVQPAQLRRHRRAAKPAAKKDYVSHREASRHVATARVLARGRLD
jgi:IS4 transposase